MKLRHVATLLTGLCFILCLSHGEPRTWANREGRTIEAEAIAVNPETVRLSKADGTLYDYPRSSLSDDDQKFLASAELTLPDIDAPLPPKPAPVIEEPGTIAKELFNKLQILGPSGITTYTNTQIKGIKYYSFIYTASWCGPCHELMPDLLQFYKEQKKKNPGYEMIMVGRDHSQEAMEAYIRAYKMPWPFVRFDKIDETMKFLRHPRKGVPALVYTTVDNHILSTSFNQRYVDVMMNIAADASNGQ